VGDGELDWPELIHVIGVALFSFPALNLRGCGDIGKF